MFVFWSMLIGSNPIKPQFVGYGIYLDVCKGCICVPIMKAKEVCLANLLGKSKLLHSGQLR